MLEDENLAKSFLKKQKETQDKFLTDLTSKQITVDTKELKSLVNSYEFAVRQAENLKPKIDTSDIQTSITHAVTKAVDNAQFTKLIDSVDAQTRAIEHNNHILQQGTGQMLKWWVMLLIALFFFGVGWGVNWCFEIPQQIVSVKKYKTILDAYDSINNTMGSDCVLAKRYIKDRGLEWNKRYCNYNDEHGNLITSVPLKTSDSIITGN